MEDVRTNTTPGTKQVHKPRLYRGCSRITQYEVLGKLGEGTFGEVHRARDRKTGNVVALKKILMHNEKDGFPITALREIKLLKLLSHPNILKLEEMSIEHWQKKDDKKKRAICYMVTPYMDHDLSGLLDNPDVHFTESHIKCYMLQLLEGTRYLHEQRILHRDMKAANLLINNQGVLQIADFGLARHYDEPPPIAGKGNGNARRDYTCLVVTRWYRPPELLMLLRRYTPAIDIWGVGCVFGEMLVGKPILSGDSDQRQLEIIFELMGSPTDDNMPGWRDLPGGHGLKPRSPPHPSTLAQRFREFGSGAISLLNELLRLDWNKRTNAIDALKHPYFKNSPLPADPGSIPMFDSSHELDRRKIRGQKAYAGPPPAPKGGTVGMGPENSWNGSNGGSYDRRHDYATNRGAANGTRYPAHPRDGAIGYPPQERRPAWQRDAPHSRPDTRLPPRPPSVDDIRGPSRYGHDGGRSDRLDWRDRPSRRDDRDIPPRSRGGESTTAGGGRPDVDTYIPSYGPPDGRRDERPRDRDDRRPTRWEDREDRRHPSASREQLNYDERSRNGRTRSRSRSPGSHRVGDDRMRDREPLDRERGIYRR